MPELVLPDTSYFESFLASHHEWAGAHEAGTGIYANADLESVEGFAAVVDHLKRSETQVETPGYVTCTFRWIVQDRDYLGSIALRHELNEYLAFRGGHVGYGVRPSARGRGLAAWALGNMLPVAHEHGLDRVLITCDDDNVASYRTIEKNGGVLESVRVDETGQPFRRYWIDVA